MAINLKKFLRKNIVKVFSLFEGCSTCPAKISPLAARVAGLPEPTFPVDIVYTWVDGLSRNHMLKRARYIKSQKKAHKDGLIAGRFLDNEELRYSLRSIEKFAPWANKVFIVTDRQIPIWLDLTSNKIKMVDHSEIIPKEYLPTFNSHTIECYLHRIPELSEHYIYFNDDFFLLKPAKKSDFFTSNGLPYAFVDWRQSRLEGYIEQKTPHACSFFNAIEYLELFGNKLAFPFITAHAPYPQLRRNVIDTFDYFKNMIQHFSYNKFRTKNEVAMYCHAAPLFSFINKALVPCDVSYMFVNIKRFDRKNYYDYLIKNKDSHDMLPLFCCFNDTTSEWGSTTWHKDLHNFLLQFFPEPSCFENRVF